MRKERQEDFSKRFDEAIEEKLDCVLEMYCAQPTT